METRSRSSCRLVLACALALAISGCARGVPPETQPEAPTIDELVVARVNGAPILVQQLEEMVQADRLRPREGGATPEPSELEARREALDLLISGELLYQAAVHEGLRIPRRELDRLVGAARPQFDSDEAYTAYLESEGLSERELRWQVERRELMRAYAGRVTGDLVLDEDRARRIYDEGKDQFRTPAQLRAALILDPVSSSDSAESRRHARETLSAIRGRAIAGENFRTLAAEHARGSGAVVQLDTGFAQRGRLLPEVAAIAFETPVGELTPVIETSRGYFLIEVLDRRPPRQRAFEEVRPSLLMLQARDQKDATLREHLRVLREKAELVISDPELRSE